MLARAISDWPGFGLPSRRGNQDFHIDPGDPLLRLWTIHSSWRRICVSGTQRGLPSQSGHVGNRGGVLSCYTGACSFEGVDENGAPLLRWLRQRGVDGVWSVLPPIVVCARRGTQWLGLGCWWT